MEENRIAELRGAGNPPAPSFEGSLLLHTCCAPCSVACIDSLREEGIEPVSYWFNPNIHPFTEYRMRRNTLREYTASIGVKLLENDVYGLRAYLDAVGGNYEQKDRCPVCYHIRLDEAARFAGENGFSAFSTTLLISPYQNHELLIAAGEAAEKKYGVEFLYRDFRPLFRQGQDRARELGLYMQKYCGCIFSEEERYQKRKKKHKEEA